MVKYYLSAKGTLKKKTRQSEGQLSPPLQNDNEAASKFKAHTGGLQL